MFVCIRSMAHQKRTKERKREEEEEKEKGEYRSRLHSKCLVSLWAGLHQTCFHCPCYPPQHTCDRWACFHTAEQYYNTLRHLSVNECRVCACSEVKAESQDSYVTGDDAVEHAQKMKRELLDQLEEVAEELPPNTLDELIDELGGPENVAEVWKRILV